MSTVNGPVTSLLLTVAHETSAVPTYTLGPRPYLESHGDLVSRLIMGITEVTGYRGY